jgi:hypothetical protein
VTGFALHDYSLAHRFALRVGFRYHPLLATLRDWTTKYNHKEIQIEFLHITIHLDNDYAS